jgi:ParB-like chromosome segregation protein Spo0J
MVVIVGHTRLLASQKLGYKKVPVFIADLSEAKAKAYRIADNRLSEDSDWDYGFLNVEMNMLNEENFDLSQLGFTTEELNNLLNDENDFEPSDLDDQADIDSPAERCEACGQPLPQ